MFGVVDLLRRFELISDGSKLRPEAGLQDCCREFLRIAEQKPLELVHGYKRDKSQRIEPVSCSLHDVSKQCGLDVLCLSACALFTRCFGAARPIQRQCVEVDKKGRYRSSIPCEVPQNISTCGFPRTNAAAPIAPSRTANDSGVNRLVAESKEVLGEQLLYESLFGSAFHMHQEPWHVLLSHRSAGELGLLPKLAEAVLIEPFCKRLAFQASDLRFPIFTVRDEDILGIEVID